MGRPMTYYEKAFVTGCDTKTEWMLEWFYKNYRKYNDTPIIFVDFGISDEMREKLFMLKMFDDIGRIPTKQKAEGWFYKPQALHAASSNCRECVWIDTDIEVLGDLSPIFDEIEDNKLAMVEDKPWTRRRGETWYNSGVVGVRGRPKILNDWMQQCKTNPVQGDQEVLHMMLNPIEKLKYITPLPNKYNWLRLQLIDGEDSPNKLAMHWTGQKGKHVIQKKIYNG